MSHKKLTNKEKETLLSVLQTRFEQNMHRHAKIVWDDVAKKLNEQADKLWSLQEMEKTGGEPDVLWYDKETGAYIFVDCSVESPKGRRSVCYDREALDARKEFKPKNSAIGMAAEMGIELLTEKQYREMQKAGPFDAKTSSWIVTPDAIRKHGGALFADYRYEHVFVYHNGAQSYYAARGFRGLLRI